MQYKKIVLGALVGITMLGGLIPLAASAITTTELVNLFVALGIIAPDKAAAALQAVASSDGTAISPASTSTTTNNNGSSSGNTTACIPISRVLRFGMKDVTTNGEVTKLQTYLQSTGDFNYSSATGFYGTVTAQAVQKWQARNGVVSSGTAQTTGYGDVGPATLKSFKDNCSPVANSAILSASPASGAAPLTVTFTGVGTSLDFGDGSPSLVSSGSPAASIGVTTHTYIFPGTYTAVSNGHTVSISVAAVIVDCAQGYVHPVGSNTTCVANTTLSASPTSGTAPLTVTFTNAGNGIDYGDGTLGPYTTGTTIGTVSHTYTTAGTYTATSGGQSTTITVSGTTATTATFSASPTSGTAPLTVTFTGNTTGTAYYVDFGDGSTPNSAIVTDCQGSVSYCLTAPLAVYVTHAYSSAGTYTALLENSSHSVVATQTISTVSGTTATTATFSASPTSGTAPLSVAYTWSGAGTNAVSVTFGDGVQSVCSSSCSSGSAPHTYVSAGTYTATFKAGATTLTKTVTVTASPTATFSASPTSGTAPLTVTFTNTGSSIDYGDGTLGPALSGGNSIGTVSHTYTTAGTYTASSGGQTTTVTVH